MRSYKTICINGKQKRLHRHIMEMHINRNLESSEIVHHIDGNKHNNDINNLEILSRGEHLKIHIKDGTVSPIEAISIHKYEDYNINDMFIIERLSAKEISKKINIPESSINFFLRKNNIKIGDRNTILCMCENEAVYKKDKLCKKCYLKKYHREAKNDNK